MHFILVVLLGIAANLDNLGIGLAYGVQKIRIPFRSNFTIAFISMIVTYVAMYGGSRIATFVSEHTADKIGGALLCSIGIWMLFHPNPSHVSSYEDGDRADTNKDRIISVREAIPLGFVLALNCVAVGIGIGVSGGSILGAVLSVGFFSFLTIGGSHRFGILIAQTCIGKRPALTAGGLLCVIGLSEFFFL